MRYLYLMCLVACNTPPVEQHPVATSLWSVAYRCDSGCYQGWRAAELDTLELGEDGTARLWRCGGLGEHATTLDDLGAQPTDVGLTWHWTDPMGAQLTAYAVEYPTCEG